MFIITINGIFSGTFTGFGVNNALFKGRVNMMTEADLGVRQSQAKEH